MSVEPDKKELMISELTSQAEKLRDELIDLERQFNAKREQFLKVQGALEALNFLSQDQSVEP